MTRFDVPVFYRSPIISTVKDARKALDPRKKNLSPSVIDFGPVRFKIARHFGFCYGVENAIEIAYKALDDNPDKRVFLLSEMIHNPHVNDDLQERGVKFLRTTSGEQLIPFEELRPDDVVIIPAFGTTLEVEETLNDLGVDTKVWRKSKQIGDDDYSIVVHGKRYHEETRATFSHAKEEGPVVVIRNMDEAEDLARVIRGDEGSDFFYERFDDKYSEGFDPDVDLQRLGVVNQTTMLATETQAIANLLREAVIDRYGEDTVSEHFADTSDTLCYATNENQDATLRLIEDGADVTVSCAEGDAGFVYEGRLEYDKTEIDPSDLPEPRVPLMLNVANPDGAFNLGWLPSAGVGLMRLEFVITNWIGVHPMALVHPEGVESARERRAIEARTEGYDDPRSYFVERLALGIAPIAAAFYPRPVIVRFSDFKTNEYAGLLGGSAFEPEESNPMIGFRGASRYYDDAYSEGFGLECAAIHKVRDEMGLTNVKVMVPFCRTLREAERVLEAMALHGLERGDIEGGSGVPKAGGCAATEDADRLGVWMMCEIPSNALLAGDFARLFDGFSIGSNDLTQLTLGVDRDSELLAHLFDESDAAVKALIAITVEKAHAAGRRVGICGEAPSNSADFAAWLADIGIDSISLSADALPGVAKRLA